jgi:hypothetical protein
MLWQRLAEHINSNQMETSFDEKMSQASVQTDLVNNLVEPVPLNAGCCSHCGSVDSQAEVLVELVQNVSPLSSEKPEDILRFFVRLEEIHNLGLVDDQIFVTRVLPLASGRLLTFLGGCLFRGGRWAQCKAQLLDKYFPYFVQQGKCITHEKECLAIIFSCEKCCTYSEHIEFELHCDNLALCWLLKWVKDVGHLGRWILHLVPSSSV